MILTIFDQLLFGCVFSKKVNLINLKDDWQKKLVKKVKQDNFFI
jgi:hypothetical protein